jgi:uncharacterized membrane protein HdeD (DUF308 family)
MTVADATADLNRRSGWVVIVAGALSLLAGILAIVFPDITLLALALIAGINLLLLGIMALVSAVTSDRDATVRVLGAMVGLLGVIAGVVVMRRPGESLLAIILILGVWFIVSGLVDAVRAFTTPEDRAFRALAAIADIALGILILALPDVSLVTLAVLAGIAFIIRGLFAIYAGVQLRRAASAAHESPPVGGAASAA